MNKIQKTILATAILVGTFGIGSAAQGSPVKSTRDNDNYVYGDEGNRIAMKSGYAEVFKRDTPRGDKNYLYTVTEFTDRWGRHCTVLTGASETAVTMDCSESVGR